MEHTASLAELQSAAIQISRVLRDAKVEPPLRAKALAALVLACLEGGRSSGGRSALAQVNERVESLLSAALLPSQQKLRLVQVLHLGGADFERLTPFIPAIFATLAKIDVNALLRRDFDFLGIFYEAFLRYGYDNNALGIVFTPRHITRFCVDLVEVGPDDRVIDIACGTGGFLVPAYEQMRQGSASDQNRSAVVCGYDTNPTVWALALLNLLLRGSLVAAPVGTGEFARPAAATVGACFQLSLCEHFTAGKSGRSSGAQSGNNPDLLPAIRIELGSCFEALRRREVHRAFTRAFLNPPFSQDAEPERDFIGAAMETLVPGGRCAAVVKAGIFADQEHASWRTEFLRQHTLLGLISLPEDLFYPTSVPTSIMVACAHLPQPGNAPVLMARVWNDGFEKLKNKRVPRAGCELPEVKCVFDRMLAGIPFTSPLAITTSGAQLKDGAEWSPQEWLPQPDTAADEMRGRREAVLAAVLRGVVDFPELAEVVLEDFTRVWRGLPALPLGKRARVEEFFFVFNGKSAGERHYTEGPLPYVSSGGNTNSIVRLVDCDAEEIFTNGGITVTAFGSAALQPWPFVARGNGGSSVRVLSPRFSMSWQELAWFVAQINAQQWRFFYARMAIKSRLERLVVSSPPSRLAEGGQGLAARIRDFRAHLADASRVH